ncbi:hypothetical protein ACFYN3_34560 [Streptomyces lavendulae]|uniref:hypothetical protein n=1 Tax=Streptomyces lavendulae TaxID=1914 RepID=UPI0036B699D9
MRVLRERLERRRLELFGSPVTDPVAWLLGRGLPQRASCWSVLCDDGHRMDTGLGCDSCAAVIGDRREARARMRSEVMADQVGGDPAARRAELERRLNLGVRHRAVMDLMRRERAAAERSSRLEAVERRRAELAAQRVERAGRECADCGMADAGGLCLACTAVRAVDGEVRKAVDVVVAMRADLTDPRAVRELSARVEADTMALANAAAEADGDGVPAAVRSFVLLSAVRSMVAQRTRWALHRLERGSLADSAAGRARSSERRRAAGDSNTADVLEAMSRAETKARSDTARMLLDDLLAGVERARRREEGGGPSARWTAVLSDLMRRPLAEELAGESSPGGPAVPGDAGACSPSPGTPSPDTGAEPG